MITADAIVHVAMFELPIIVGATIRAVTPMRLASSSASGDIIMMADMILAGMDSEATGLEDMAAGTTIDIGAPSPECPIEQMSIGHAWPSVNGTRGGEVHRQAGVAVLLTPAHC